MVRAGRKASRVATALYKESRKLRAVSPVSTPLAFRRPTAAAANGKTTETPQQAARRQAKAQRRLYEDQLWGEYLGSHSDDARNALWVHYQPLVRYIAERLKAKLPECIDVCDLIGAGNIGLQDAISKFEPQMNVRFETYCVPRIRGAILDSIRALDWVPRLIRNKTHQYERIVRELAGQLHREPSEDEIARRLAINSQEFSELRRELNVKAQISVESRNKDNADPRDLMRIEMLEHPDDVEPTRELQREEIRAMALRGLNSKERVVVEQYYFRGRSMKQIGDELKLSESRICQIHAGVLEVLRKKFRAYQGSCYLG
jgi:RNA polymerase sigma factor for flagellar operon FliA